MKITSLQLNFKGQSKSDIFGYSDNPSKTKRDYIRCHIDETYMPNRDTFEQEGRREKYELNKLISSFVDDKKTPVDNEKIQALGMPQCKSIGNNSYRGAMFCERGIWKLPKLKEAGITQIADLTYCDELKKACAKIGINYITAPLGLEYDACPAYQTREEALEDSIIKHEILNRTSEEEIQKNIKNDLEYWKQKKDRIVSDFVKFIQGMQKGNTYIGCDWGTVTTDVFVFYNSLFNPKAILLPKSLFGHINMKKYAKCAEKFYRNLTEDDKKKMGWDEEYEKEFLRRIESYKS